MKNLKSILMATLSLCCSLPTVQGITYRYDWVPTVGPTPISLDVGYLDLTASSGVNVASGTAIVDWSLSTPFGTLNKGNSSIFNVSSLLSWNSSTITGIVLQVINQTTGANPEQIYFPDSAIEVDLLAGFPSPTLMGSWRAETSSSVPDCSGTIGLLGIGLLGLCTARRALAI